MGRAADIAKSLRRAAKRILTPSGGFERSKKGKGAYTRKRKHRRHNAD